ncbi:MAG TPA: 5-formyltetrahydrofolate cyclo-ligase [Leucothrix sp.]|nr:5-formyltetrahydrofolate cyclo-ligase [Leucothrix sp.]
MATSNQNKDNLRTLILNERGEHSKASHQQKSENIVKQVSQSPPFKKAKRVAFYFAVRGEADPQKLMIENHADDKTFYLPVLSQNKKQGLLFAPIKQNTQYKNNKFSIPEPICDHNALVTGDSLDLVLMPLLGFDKQGNRLGMGGGFYDRTFSFKRSKKIKPVLMGFAYDFQEIDALKAEDWDIPMDYIATESKLFII